MDVRFNQAEREKRDRKNAETERSSSKVDHPDHYNQGSFEVIDVIEDQGHIEGFCVGNAIKYLCRYKNKGTPLEDLKKARWYIDRLISNIEGQEK